MFRSYPHGQGYAIGLFLEPNNADVIENGDNIVMAPWGDLLVCEDGANGNRVIGVTPNGETYPLMNNVYNAAELAGACFSPDGSTLFINLYTPGMTLAIERPRPDAVLFDD